MRWERLFADLEALFTEMADAEAAAEHADRERVAIGAIRSLQRLGGSVGAVVRLHLAGGALIDGTLRTVGADWLLIEEGMGRDCLVAWDAVVAVGGLTTATAAPATGLDRRLDLRRALRGLARDRAPVAIALSGWAGGVVDSMAPSTTGSAEVVGTIDRVGADFLEVAVHAAWEPRRSGAVRAVVLVPLRAVMLVRAVPLG
ncbi:hypothetical protein ACVBEQ_20060 [Nakamurella sp. GG22]